MREEEPHAVDGVDAAEPQLAELVALVDCVEGVDVDVCVELGDEGLPPGPGEVFGDEAVVVGELQVQRGADQPHVREEEAGRGFVQCL